MTGQDGKQTVSQCGVLWLGDFAVCPAQSGSLTTTLPGGFLLVINMNGQNLAVAAPTMSSREIADLVQSRHADVCKSIERLMESGAIQGYAATPYTHAQNSQQYKEYLINERDSYVIVAQLSPAFTAQLVDRWQELERSRPAQVMTDAERLLITAQALVSLERGQQQMQAQIDQQAQKIEQIAAGAIPAGWQTIANLAMLCGLTPDKTRQLIKNFGVPNKKIPFMAPTGVLTSATVADEEAFKVSFAELKRTASRPLRGVMWSHPKLGKFQMRAE